MNALKQSATGILGVAIVLGIIIAANAIVSQFNGFRLDMTEENLYTLSDGTRSMLADLERDVTLKFYYSRSGDGTPIPIKQYAQRIQDLLREYESADGGKLVLDIFDPKPDSDEEEWAQKYGLTPQSLGMFGGPSFYFGIVAVSGANEAAIPFLDPGAEPRLEYLVTRLVHEVSRTDKPKIGVMSSLPIMGTPAMPYGPQPQQGAPPWIFVRELENMYDVVEVKSTVETIPEEITALFVVHPKDFPDSVIYAIDQFVLQGGKLLLFVDAMCMTDPGAGGGQFGPMQSGSDLNKLTGAWGLELEAGKVAGDKNAATQLNVGGGSVDTIISWLSLRNDQINREEISTSMLEFVMLPFPGLWKGEPAEGLELTSLAGTSDNSGVINTFQAMGASAAMREALEKRDPAPLIARLQGSFKSAFPDGRPSDTPENEEGPAPAANESHLTESSVDSVVILVSDVDMIADQYSVQVRNFFGQQIAEPINDNLNLVLNFAEQLSGSDSLIGLRSRGTYQRPFTRVNELEAKAQEQWKLEEQKLQTKVQDAQQRLRDLQRGKDEDQKLILSPEQQAEIKKFNEELFDYRQQLKEVRKNLRKEIESLGVTLKVINIAAVPLLVAVFGIVRGVQRRKAAQR